MLRFYVYFVSPLFILSIYIYLLSLSTYIYITTLLTIDLSLVIVQIVLCKCNIYDCFLCSFFSFFVFRLLFCFSDGEGFRFVSLSFFCFVGAFSVVSLDSRRPRSAPINWSQSARPRKETKEEKKREEPPPLFPPLTIPKFLSICCMHVLHWWIFCCVQVSVTNYTYIYIYIIQEISNYSVN